MFQRVRRFWGFSWPLNTPPRLGRLVELLKIYVAILNLEDLFIVWLQVRSLPRSVASLWRRRNPKCAGRFGMGSQAVGFLWWLIMACCTSKKPFYMDMASFSLHPSYTDVERPNNNNTWILKRRGFHSQSFSACAVHTLLTWKGNYCLNSLVVLFFRLGKVFCRRIKHVLRIILYSNAPSGSWYKQAAGLKAALAGWLSLGIIAERAMDHFSYNMYVIGKIPRRSYELSLCVTWIITYWQPSLMTCFYDFFTLKYNSWLLIERNLIRVSASCEFSIANSI